jgi:hypothetical protein
MSVYAETLTKLLLEYEDIRELNAELLTALKSILARIRDLDDMGPSDEGWQSKEFRAEIRAADAAIAKAEELK